MMSDKAIGADWKRSSVYTLRHCAGAREYTALPQRFYEAVEAHDWRVGRRQAQFRSAYSLTFSDCVENDSESPELQFSTGRTRV